MTALAIQKNLDGTASNLKLKEIFAIEPKAKALFDLCVCHGLASPLDDPTVNFNKSILPKIKNLVGWDAQNPVLSAPETFETLHKACFDAANCWIYWRNIKDKKWGWAAFKKKFGKAPNFSGMGPFGR